MRRAGSNPHRQSGVTAAGFTLVEMLVVMGIFAFVLASASVALAALWRAQSDVEQELLRTITAERLTRQLRADTHLAESVNVIPKDTDQHEMLRMTQSATRTEYTRESNSVVRVAYEGDRVLHREVYWLDENVSVSWNVTEPPRSQLSITLAYFDSRLGESAPPTRIEKVESVVGLSWRGSQ